MVPAHFHRVILFFFLFLILACSSKTKATEPPEPPKKANDVTQTAASTKKRSSPSLPLDPSNWRTFRGGARRTGQSAFKGPRTAKPKWVFRTEGRIYADPVIGEDGTLYVASHDGKLYAIDETGREKWSFDAGGKIWSSPAIAEDGTIYFGSDADIFFAVTEEGQAKWTVTTTLPPEKKGATNPDGKWDVDTAPAVAPDGTIYFGCHYYLYALRPSGALRWRFQAGTERVKIFSSPSIGKEGNIYFGTQGKRFFALDSNANPLWNIETERDNDSTAAVGADGRIYFGSDDGKVRAVNASDGAILWEAALSAPIRAPIALSRRGTVFAATYGKAPFLAALNSTDGLEKWRFKIEPGEGDFYGIQSGPTIDAEGYIYFGGRDHYIYCISPDGKLKWRYKTGDQVDSGPVIGPDGTLYVGSDDKRLYAFES